MVFSKPFRSNALHIFFAFISRIQGSLFAGRGCGGFRGRGQEGAEFADPCFFDRGGGKNLGFVGCDCSEKIGAVFGCGSGVEFVCFCENEGERASDFRKPSDELQIDFLWGEAGIDQDEGVVEGGAFEQVARDGGL